MTAWTREKPSKKGWYWFRSGKRHVSQRVVEFHMDGERAYAVESGIYAEYLDGEWQGPIEPEA